jgi:hypothetical protein
VPPKPASKKVSKIFAVPSVEIRDGREDFMDGIGARNLFRISIVWTSTLFRTHRPEAE